MFHPELCSSECWTRSMDFAGRLKKDLPGVSKAKVLGAVDGDHDMINIAANLKHRFWQFEYDLLECWDALGFPPRRTPIRRLPMTAPRRS